MDYQDYLTLLETEPSQEDIAEYVAFLRPIVKEARAYWDALGEPYPEHLKSAIDYLSQREENAN